MTLLSDIFPALRTPIPRLPHRTETVFAMKTRRLGIFLFFVCFLGTAPAFPVNAQDMDSPPPINEQLDPEAVAEQLAVSEERAPIRVLAVTATHGFRHSSIETVKELLPAVAATTEFEFDITEDLTLLNDEHLAGYDLLLFANSTLRVKAEAEESEENGGAVIYGFTFQTLEGAVEASFAFENLDSDTPSGSVLTAPGAPPIPLEDLTYDPPMMEFSFDTQSAYGHIYVSGELTPDTFDARWRSVLGDGALPVPATRLNPEDTAVPDGMTEDQREVIRTFLASGKGIAGAHAALDALYGWDWYRDMVGGGLFKNHPWTQSVRIRIEDPENPAVAHFGDGFRIRDEIYVLDENPRWNVHVLASLDMRSVGIEEGPASTLANDYPIAWLQEYGGAPYVYLYYTEPKTFTNTLSRFTYREGALDMASKKVLLRVPTEPQCCHQAGDIEWGPDGSLYLSTGDTGMSEVRPQWEISQERIDNFMARHDLSRIHWTRLVDSERSAQNLQDLRGKILRIHKDGSIPKDNPFFGEPGVRWEIYAYGLRNPYRFKVDHETGALYIGVVGPDAGFDYDEYNISEKGGENFGWPRNMGRLFYNEITPEHIPDFVPPIWEYTYESGGRSATVGPIYRHEGESAFPDLLQNGLFVYDWSRRWIKWGHVSDGVFRSDVEQSVKNTPLALRIPAKRLLDIKTFDVLTRTAPISIETGPDGSIYVAEFDGFWDPGPNARLTRYRWIPNNSTSSSEK